MIIVLTCGKVASTSIRRCLMDAYGDEVHYAHGLQPRSVETLTTMVKGMRRARGDHPATREVEALTKETIRTVNRLARARRSGERIDIVTGVRDPIARSISAILQNAEIFLPRVVAEGPEAAARDLTGRLQRLWRRNVTLQSDFIRHFMGIEVTTPLVWYEQEIERPFALDMRAEPFDHARGWAIRSAGPVRLLVYRLENGQSAVEAGLAELFGRGFTLPAANVTRDKTVGDLQASLLARFRMPRDLARMIYATPHVAHHYTRDERQRFVERWTGG